MVSQAAAKSDGCIHLFHLSLKWGAKELIFSRKAVGKRIFRGFKQWFQPYMFLAN